MRSPALPLRTTLILLMLGAGTVHAATLAEALDRWTGVTADVVGAGEHVRVVLPPGSPIPAFSARAVPATEQGDPGWRLTDITLPNPSLLASGFSLSAASQRAEAGLGTLRAHVTGQYQTLAVHRRDSAWTLATLGFNVAATASGPVQLDVAADGLRLSHTTPSLAALLPRQVRLHGRTTQQGIEALVAIFGGAAGAAPAPLSIESLDFDSGPAHISGSGNVTIRSPQDRQGRVELEVTGFDALVQQLPHDGDGARLFAPLLLLRGMAKPGGADGQALVWVVEFSGRQMLVNGLDLGPLLGL